MACRTNENDLKDKLDRIEAQVEVLKADLEMEIRDEQARIRLARILTELEARLASLKVDFIGFKSESSQVWKDTREALTDAILALEQDFQHIQGNFQDRSDVG